MTGHNVPIYLVCGPVCVLADDYRLWVRDDLPDPADRLETALLIFRETLAANLKLGVL